MIHFECLTEECLLFSLGVSKSEITHHSGKGQVCKILEKGENLTGLVDEDPDAMHHSYYKRMIQFKLEEKFGIIHCFDKSKSNTMIVVKPRFEDWIIEVTSGEKVKMSDFNLSDDPVELHRIITFRKGDLENLLRFLRKNKCKALAFIEEIIL
jgi:hypothetical protein